MNSHWQYLGIDLGSVSLDGAVIDEGGNVLWHSYRKVQGRSRDAVATLCHDLVREWTQPRGVTSFAGAMATGSGKEIVRDLLGLATVNEIVAHGSHAARLAGVPASVIEIGGQDSKFIVVDAKGAGDYSMNELCAAGTGAFLDVQAERLGLTIEEFSALAAQAAQVPPMAGRCSVFAKSDIIHLQQRGVPVDEIVAGLCYALARNYLATLIRGRELVRPVIFQGGVALNDGVLRAFRDILGLAASDVIRPPLPHLAGSIGAALLGRETASPLPVTALARLAARPVASAGGPATQGWQMEAAAARQLNRLESRTVLGPPRHDDRLIIGLDSGSISTKAVAMATDGRLLAKVYLFTAGQPLNAARLALATLSESIGRAKIAGVGVTGSGRKLVGHAIGADLVIDEITAQARGARHGMVTADTVIEIGGQDAKFIRLTDDGAVLDFEMNRACSAGTGSFIQEQAIRLGVELGDEFADLALSSQKPLPFASRCTVFMESDLVHHIQQGVPVADLLMGVSQAVVENYIARVAQGRKFGRRIVLQGGVALNRAVVKAFRTRLADSKVTVHPHPGVSGAIGMALLTRERLGLANPEQPGTRSSFKGADFSAAHETSVFTCQGCENRCAVTTFDFKAQKFRFGDLCGRYSEAVGGFAPGEDLTAEPAGPPAITAGQTVMRPGLGIPETLLFHEFHPFWHDYFAALNIPISRSGPSSSAKLGLALARLPAETCLPVKLLFGHVAALVGQGIDTVFIPAMARLFDGACCPYIQHGAAMVQANFKDLKVVTLPLAPGLTDKEKERLAQKAAEAFGVSREAAAQAYETATQGLARCRQGAAGRVPATGPRPRPLAVLLGKPYNTDDRFVNMALAAKLAKAGFDVVAGARLGEPEDLELPVPFNSVTWAFNRRMLRIGLRLRQYEDAYPVVVGNFGCGPDSFTFPLLQEIFGSRPSLFLEFDEHRADAGLATRVEAFAHRVANFRAKARTVGPDKARRPGRQNRWPGRTPNSGQVPEYFIPYFSDHSHAFAGAIASKGFKATVLPIPDHSAYEAGVELSGGRQCHPFQLFAGDLIKLARAGRLPPGARYILPAMKSSCLVTQYVPTIQLYMNKLNRNDVKVISANSLELLQEFGPMFVFNLGKALLGIEYLSRLRFERRPYELLKGTVDQAYLAGLEIILQGEREERVNQGIIEAARLLGAVPTAPRGSKPVIAIAGDAYTRINPAANGGLFDLLEELGCEVWPSPTMVDVIMTGQEMNVRRFWEEGKPLDMMASWGRVLVNNLGANFVLRQFAGLLANLTEPSAQEVTRLTDGLLPGEPELLVSLNVAKHVDFANKGVDGILNVYCLNCLVGTATTSIFKSLIERTAGVPMMPLVFDAMGGTHIRNRVEAFVHRVKRNREAKLAGATAARGAERCVVPGHVASLRDLLDRKLNDVKMPDMTMPDFRMPDFKLPAMRMPLLKIPPLLLGEGLRDWKRKKAKAGDQGDNASPPA